MPSAWDEMEEYESGGGSAIHPACWLGQYFFGLLAGLLGSFFISIFLPPSMQPPSGVPAVSSSLFSPLSISDVVVPLFSSLGVFAGSSGGGDPLDPSSGGGPLSLLAIFLSSLAAVLASTLLLCGRDLGSALPACSAAAAIGTTVAGWGVAVQLELGRAEPGEEDEDEEGNGGGGGAIGGRIDVEAGEKSASRRKASGKRRRSNASSSCAKLSRRDIYNGILADLSDPQTVLRIATVFTVSIGIHLMYGGAIFRRFVDEDYA
jgi:hypothetical protein